MNSQNNKEHLVCAAEAVEAQLVENPVLGISVDPDVADFMGAFEESAVSVADMDYEFGGGDAA